jgi:YD repeat-containing protein
VSTARLTVPGTGRAEARGYDPTGRLVSIRRTGGQDVLVTVPPGGFVVVTRRPGN